MKDQFFADYWERLEDLRYRLYKDVADLSAGAMDWSPGPEMNSAAVLLAHITGVVREGIDLALDNPPSRVRKGISDAGHPERRDAEPPGHCARLCVCCPAPPRPE